MSHKIVISIVFVITSILVTGCAPNASPTPDPMIRILEQKSNYLLLWGKIVNTESNEWLNDRIVIIYLKGIEIGRGISNVSTAPLYTTDITDGIFKIPIINQYELRLNEMIFSEFSDVRFGYGDGYVYAEVAGIGDNWENSDIFRDVWVGELEIGNLYTVPVPSRNLEFKVKVLGGSIHDLPAELLEPGSTELIDGDQIVLKLEHGGESTNERRILVKAVKTRSETEEIEVNKFTIPINNCGGNAAIRQSLHNSQTFFSEYSYKVGGSAGLEIPVGWGKIVTELEANYGFKQGQVNVREVNYDIEVEQGSYVAYVITWTEVWESGNAIIEANGENITIPFDVKANLIYKVDSEKYDCP